jgi:tripartite-type tricarboxylate transporter receptor subunit TctC
VRLVPDLPAIAEMIPGFNNTTWYGILAPAGTPAGIVAKLNTEIRSAVADPAFRERLETMGLDPISSTPEELRSRIRSELARWTKVIDEAGVGLKR